MHLQDYLRSAAATGLLLALSVGAAESAPPGVTTADALPAILRVALPADAVLAIDGEPTKSMLADRVFVTPPLETGKDFHYTLRAAFVRGDQTVTVERRVAVRAGRETVVSLYPADASPSGGEWSRPGNQAYYYSPAPPMTGPAVPIRPRLRYSPVAPPDDGNVGGARDNWKPDFSDPFLRGPG